MASDSGKRVDKCTCHLVCIAMDIRKHLLSFPLEGPTDFMCIKDEKITYSASALKRRRSGVTWLEFMDQSRLQKTIVDGMRHGF